MLHGGIRDQKKSGKAAFAPVRAEGRKRWAKYGQRQGSVVPQRKTSESKRKSLPENPSMEPTTVRGSKTADEKSDRGKKEKKSNYAY